MIKELEKKIGQLQYEISLLGHGKEELTGVTNRTEELKYLVKNLTIIKPPIINNCLSCGIEIEGKIQYCDVCYCKGELAYTE